MQVWDQVKLKKVADGDEESLGRAGVVRKVHGTGDAELVTVELDETESHEAGLIEVPADDLEFLGR
jgi:hypothetical protein